MSSENYHSDINIIFSVLLCLLFCLDCFIDSHTNLVFPWSGSWKFLKDTWTWGQRKTQGMHKVGRKGERERERRVSHGRGRRRMDRWREGDFYLFFGRPYVVILAMSFLSLMICGILLIGIYFGSRDKLLSRKCEYINIRLLLWKTVASTCLRSTTKVELRSWTLHETRVVAFDSEFGSRLKWMLAFPSDPIVPVAGSNNMPLSASNSISYLLWASWNV